MALQGDGRGEVESNFIQLLKLFSEGDLRLSAWLEKKSNKYTGHDVQNEMLQIMALRMLREIASNIQSSMFTIMVDETTDASTREQVVIVLRWVDDELMVHEDLIGLHLTDSIDSDSLVTIIHDVLRI